MKHNNRWLARRVCIEANVVRIEQPERFKGVRDELQRVTRGGALRTLHERTLRHLVNRYHGLIMR